MKRDDRDKLLAAYDSSDRDKLLAAYDIAAITDSDVAQVICRDDAGEITLVGVIARGKDAQRLARWLEKRQ